MFLRQALTSILHLFVVLAFFTAGLFFVSFTHFPEIKAKIFEKSELVGLGLFSTSLVLLLGFYALDRGRFLVIKMGVKTNISVVRQSIEECMSTHFNKKMVLSDVEIDRKSQIEIRVKMAQMDEAEKEKLLQTAEKELGTLLKERFGYLKTFHLIVKI